MRWLVAFLVWLPACEFPQPLDVSADGSPAIDANQVANDGAPPDAAACYGSFVQVCFFSVLDAPVLPVTLNDDIDTDSVTVCDQHNFQAKQFCIVPAAGLSVPATKTIRAYGSKPLILLSTTAVNISGNIDISSTINTPLLHPIGAGAVTLDACAAGAIAPQGDSGGYGASFAGHGGIGKPQGTAIIATPGPPIEFPSVLRGGCPGSSGSSTVHGFSPNPGGSGGGAVDVIAAEIFLGGQINASGAAGVGGPAVQSGGGGGGSGGMIVLDATTIIPSGTYALFANGGGGGQGGAGPGEFPGAGKNGLESTGPFISGLGGNNLTTSGGGGGDGAAGIGTKDARDAPDVSIRANGGGGGGGGSVGFIRAHGVTANVAPAPTDP